MNQGGKVVLGLLALGGIGAIVFASGKANAAPAPTPGPTPNPFPSLPPGTLPPFPSSPSSNSGGGGAPVIPAPGTSIPLPGGGSVPVPSIPGVNTPSQPNQPLPSLPTLPSIPGLTPSAGPAQVPQAPVLPTVPGPAPAPNAPPASAPELPSTAPADTIDVVTGMLAQEQNPHWRIIPYAPLRAWQKARGLVADGDYGTGTALKMAEEIGTLPIIRGWPKGSTPHDGKLDNYRASLQQIANAAPEPRASQLRAAAVREAGQGYGTPETPIVHLITLQ
ncbi:MAG TPA: hypothetical protein VNM39_13340 [Verrucomicrobiae bacterium]|nr:hypothetical protein [Verrucomicrobiae bacterium]